MALLDYHMPWSEPVRRLWRPYSQTAAFVQGPDVSNSKDVWRKCMIIRSSKSIVLPTDWNPNRNLWILWGAGGKGQGGFHTFGANFAGCGGGGGGCRVFRNVGSSNLGFQRGDVVNITVGVGNGREWVDSRAVNATTFAMASNPSQGAGAASGSNSGPVGTNGTRGLGGDDNPAFPNNMGGLSFTVPGGGGSCAGPSSFNVFSGDYNAGLYANVAPIGALGGQSGAGAMWCAPYFRSEPGQNPTSTTGPRGGNGPYGTGGGVGSGADATPNTGGGGSGGDNPGGSGGKGASWTYGMSLTTDTWLNTEGTLEFSVEGLGAAGDWGSQCFLLNFQMLNGTVPAGGGGGAGSAWNPAPGSGGDGGWPGGGGGSTDQVVDPNKLPGNGADGLLIIFYDPVPPVWFPAYPDIIFPDPLEYQRKMGPQYLPQFTWVPTEVKEFCPSIDGGPIAITPELCPPETAAMVDQLTIWMGMKG